MKIEFDNKERDNDAFDIILTSETEAEYWQLSHLSGELSEGIYYYHKSYTNTGMKLEIPVINRK